MQKQSWLASFTDLLILLICMFVMIFSLSEQNRKGAKHIVNPENSDDTHTNAEEPKKTGKDELYLTYNTIKEELEKLPLNLRKLIELSYEKNSFVEVTLYFDSSENPTEEVMDQQIQFLQKFFKQHYYSFNSKDFKIIGYAHDMLKENSRKYNLTEERIVKLYNSLLEEGYSDNLDLGFANIPRSRYNPEGFSNIFLKIMLQN